MTGLKLNELGTVDETKQNCETNARLTIQSALTSITHSCKCAPLKGVEVLRCTIDSTEFGHCRVRKREKRISL